MKTRNGFVSNSSSSSFIVVLPKAPKSVDDVKEMFFNNENVTISDGYNPIISADEAARSLFSQMESSESSISDALEEFSYLSDPSLKYPYSYEQDDKKYKKMLKEYESKNEEYCRRRAYEMLHDLDENSVVYRLSYGDDNGPFESIMEHGNAFDNVRHIKISHH